MWRVLAVSVLMNIFLLYKLQSGQENTFTIDRVIDGDTVILAPNNLRARLGNIESPELDFCGGQEAYTRLKQLVEGQKVTVKFSGEDVYNRSIVYLFADGKLVNETLLAEGLVRYDGTASQYRDQLKAAYQKAAEDKTGIYGLCRSTQAKNNCRVKGNIDKQTPKKTYFVPGCNEYDRTIVEEDRGEKWFCTEKEAVSAGYAPGGNCP